MLAVAACGGGKGKPSDAGGDMAADAAPIDLPHGPFRDAVRFQAPGAVDVKLADIDGDGLVDVVVAGADQNANFNAQVTVFRNTTPTGAATPSFAAPS